VSVLLLTIFSKGDPMKRMLISLTLLLAAGSMHGMQKQKEDQKQDTEVGGVIVDAAVALLKLPFQLVYYTCKLGVEGAVATASAIKSTLSPGKPPKKPEDNADHNEILRDVRGFIQHGVSRNVSFAAACGMAQRHVQQKWPQVNWAANTARRILYRRHIRQMLEEEGFAKSTATKKCL